MTEADTQRTFEDFKVLRLMFDIFLDFRSTLIILNQNLEWYRILYNNLWTYYNKLEQRNTIYEIVKVNHMAEIYLSQLLKGLNISLLQASRVLQ